MANDHEEKKDFAPSCPIPSTEYPHILLAHGGGGTLSHSLIDKIFVPTFGNRFLDERHDGAVIDLDEKRLAFTTDSYVVRPLFFPGGDIGTLAVNGTVNDLAMCGARPLYLSAGFVLEEGLPVETIWRIARSMKDAADAAGVQIVTGDTKVVDKGKGDQVFINTSGVGVVESDRPMSPNRVRAGDVVLINGDIGRHGIAIMAKREGLDFETIIESDCAPLADPVLNMIRARLEIHCLRDLTRGGLASATIEIAESAGVQIDLDETSIPVSEPVRAACEILGFDPIHVANEGRFVTFVDPKDADGALEILKAHPLGADARIIGNVSQGRTGLVTLRTAIGTQSIVDMLSGEQLPRIC